MIIDWLFMIGLALIPFTGINGFSFVGELQRELSAHIFLLALGLSVFPALSILSRRNAAEKEAKALYALPLVAAVFFGADLVSFVVNFPSIQDNFFLGRTGLYKFISTNILVLYGFALAALTYFLAQRHSWDKLILRPLAWAVIFCAVFSVFEILGRRFGLFAGVYEFLSSIVHSRFGELEWDLRLRSVAYEPPDFANTAGYIWPWLLGAAQFSEGRRRTFYFGLWIVLNIMIVLSEARTSLVVVSGLLGVFILLRVFYLPLRQTREAEKSVPLINTLLLLVVPAAFLFLALFADDVVRIVTASDRESNISRLASMTASFRVFADNPLFGVGWGQAGFYWSHYMPSWGFMSSEIKGWLADPEGFWPVSFSIYGRFAADMGVLGLLMWVGIWLGLAWSVLKATLAHRAATGEIPFAAYPLIMSCVCVLLAGLPSDSLRAPMIWINMGLACRYLYEMKRTQIKRAKVFRSK